jgi:alpha-D-ribose 1-methylphosphonate 5-triphosphate synthase subunit PhnG
MAKKLSSWNLFVKKIYAEGKAKNPNYKFKQALADASSRKGEMKNSSSSVMSEPGEKKTKKRRSKKQKKTKTSKKR